VPCASQVPEKFPIPAFLNKFINKISDLKNIVEVVIRPLPCQKNGIDRVVNQEGLRPPSVPNTRVFDRASSAEGGAGIAQKAGWRGSLKRLLRGGRYRF
jgi:hypothetical protein